MSEFTEISKEIARDFLHSVIFADDRIGLNQVLEEKIITPTREILAKEEPKVEKPLVDTSFDIAPIISEFLKQGIPCSFYTLKELDTPEMYIKNFKKADALILDWQIKHDDGEFILSILDGIFDKTRNSLKVVLIYTGSNGLVEIIDKIKNHFPDIQFEVDSDDNCSIKCGSFKVSVYAKTGIAISQQLQHRVKDEIQLIEALIDDFISITAGLITNTVLKAITVIRQDTHRILSLYNKELDSAFLAHRGSLPVVDDAGELLKDSIINSLKAILDYNDVESYCSINPIKKWMSKSNFSEKEILLNKKALKVSKSGILNWQKIGFIDIIKELWKKQFPAIELDDEKVNNIFNKEIHKIALSFFLPDGVANDSYEEKFSILTHHKSNYANPAYTPRLTLGTIIQGERTHQYWLCVQQKCDSVRLDDKPRRFLFLPLSVAKENGKFNYIIPSGASFVKVKVDLDTYNLRTIKFNANKAGAVQARRYGKSSNYFFIQHYRSKTAENFKWILDLKDAHAQRIANMYAAKLARVGLDESEWLRRWSGN